MNLKGLQRNNNLLNLRFNTSFANITNDNDILSVQNAKKSNAKK